ncbi:MAG: RnfABCDGE type electron transport complex subunit G [Pseudazoarcus pumilus]|nr:RnfABCDGE type electron transport complex subunit G [Pseudazoarcus pumilus]
MLVFTIAFTAMMSLTYKATAPTIAASQQAEKMRLIDEILPRGSYDNDLLADFLNLGSVAALGLERGGTAWRARRSGEPVAVVVEAVAPDGYAGRIQLAVAVTADGRVSGVRVTAHGETPGLGDYIDPKKDRKRDQPWISQFSGKSSEEVPLERWKVGRDGGDFDYRIGATISARAVTDATGRALAWVVANRERLFDAAAGSTL